MELRCQRKDCARRVVQKEQWNCGANCGAIVPRKDCACRVVQKEQWNGGANSGAIVPR